ncbi:prepilin-type N-terminal cleavage/methylation domain-containing protein [Candidatus Uhrbacteria bacterium]|nr:prepilin-type N-terminal cleavage/methylation domain-containing protein [Candidatus Uhrbacteria bacterium]
MRKNFKGFTLIELLVVIAIIGLLSTLAVVSLSSARAKARDATRITAITQLKTALELYNSEKGEFPAGDTTNPTELGKVTTTDCLSSTDAGFVATNSTTACTDPKYMTQVPLDPQSPTQEYKYYAFNDAAQCASAGTGATPAANSSCNHYVILFKLEGASSGNYKKGWNCVSDTLPGGKSLDDTTAGGTIVPDTCKL